MTTADSGRVARTVRLTLTVGILLAAGLLALGLAVALAAGTAGIFGPPNSVHLGALLGGLANAPGPTLVLLGVLLLLLTPIARVAVSLGLFARARDRPFVAITAFVLAVLALSFAIGAAP